jgi:hypothetical protein
VAGERQRVQGDPQGHGGLAGQGDHAAEGRGGGVKPGAGEVHEPPAEVIVGDFLGHSPRTVADRHYVVPPQELLDEAVTWLGRQLGQVP